MWCHCNYHVSIDDTFTYPNNNCFGRNTSPPLVLDEFESWLRCTKVFNALSSDMIDFGFGVSSDMIDFG